MSRITTTRDTRLLLAGICLLLSLPLLVAAHWLKRIPGNDPREMLDAVAASPAAWTGMAWSQAAAALLLLPGVIALVALVRGRGFVLAHVAGALVVLNLFGNVADLGRSGIAQLLAGGGVTAADVTLLEALFGNALFLAVDVLVALGLLGYPLLAVALFRSGVLPRPVPALMALGFVAFFTPLPEVVGALLLGSGFALAGVSMLRVPAAAKDEAPQAPAGSPAVARTA
jgi:hypothetical protein